MAIGAALKNIVREVAGTLARYAADHGWNRGEYQVYYHVNSKWDRIHIIFVSEHFDDIPEFTNFVSVQNYLRKEFADHPQLFTFLNLLPRSSRQVEEGGIYAIGPNFREFKKFQRQ